VGNARSALFSWAFTRHQGGAFVLRVEDTDTGRVSEEAFHGVMESLRWLGIDWDEGPDVGGPHGPYRQSQRGDLYDERVRQLLEQGDAYPCYCAPEELEERRRAAQAEGRAPGYDGRCRALTDAERASREAEGRPKVIRFAMPQRDLTLRDLVKGDVHFAAGALQDFVLVRSDGSPVFLLAVAVDDMMMGMTHVIRGEDLLASAPRNAAVIEALGGTAPRYAHLPLLVGADRQPLSKRHGSTSVEALREQGFLPEALVNYLSLLGWSKDAETTFLTREELVTAFDLSRVSSNPAAFDPKKLEWMNNHYIQQLDLEELAARCLHFLTAAGLTPDLELLRRSMPLVRERMKRLTESVDLLTFLFTDDIELDEKARAVVAKAPEGYMGRVARVLSSVDPWISQAIEAALDGLAEREGLTRKNAFQPVRAAVTGSVVSPPLPESMELLGRDRTVERIGRS
jgi:glutamyl-tRNA synthetase